jgi:hypothetical protein
MHNELRYQAKIHTISEKLSKEKEKNKNSASSPTIFFFLACKVRANLTSRGEVWNYQDRKAAARRAFSVIPIKYLQKFFSKQTRENMVIENIWFIKQNARYEKDMT